MISICYFTSRMNPRFEWFYESLGRQRRPGDEIEIIVVDGKYGQRTLPYSDVVKVVEPKPTPWSGRYRKTREDWWSASSARNTAFCYASGDYVVCIDDLSVCLPEWLAQVRHAAQHRYLVMGMYKKLRNLCVSDGCVKDFDQPYASVDSRWPYGRDDGIVPFPATSLFGCSFGLPMETILQVNGFDEKCDGTSMEDVVFGSTVARTGIKSYLNRNMLTYECEECHSEGTPMRRESRKVQDFSYEGHDTSDWWLMANCVRNEGYKSSALLFDLPTERNKLRETGQFSLPTITHDWATCKPLEEL